MYGKLLKEVLKGFKFHCNILAYTLYIATISLKACRGTVCYKASFNLI